MWWLIKEAVVAGARVLDNTTSRAVTKAFEKAFAFVRDRLIPNRPAR